MADGPGLDAVAGLTVGIAIHLTLASCVLLPTTSTEVPWAALLPLASAVATLPGAGLAENELMRRTASSEACLIRSSLSRELLRKCEPA